MSNGDTGQGDPNAPNFDLLGKSIAGAMSQISDFTFLKTVPSNFIAEGVALVLALPFKFLADLVVLAAKVLVDLLSTAGPETGALASIALSEVFGEEVTVRTGRGGVGPGTSAQLGASILNRLLPQLSSGDQSTGPTAKPAETFMGELLGVSIRAWLLEFLSDLMPEAVRVAPFNDLIDAVLGATGISRLARVALRPAITHAIATPLEWLVLDILRPTLLSEGQAVKAYNSNLFSRQALDDELGAKGYSVERQAIVIGDQLKYLPLSDLRVLVKNQVKSDRDATLDLQAQGWPEPTARQLLNVAHLEEIDALRPRAIAALEQQFKRGKLDDGGFLQALGALKIRDDVANFWLNVLHLEQDSGFKILDLAQLNRALAANVISLPEWRSGLRLLEYSDDDITILELTEQGVLTSHDRAAQLKAQQKADMAAGRAQAKADAAAAKAAKVQAAQVAKQAASDARVKAQVAREAALLEKQKLLAEQAQARRDQIAKAKAAGLLAAEQEASQLAAVQLAEQQAAQQVAEHAASQTALDAAAGVSDQAALDAQAAAEAAARDAQAATALANEQAAALNERRQERIALYQAEIDKIDHELETGLITQSTHDKQLASLQVSQQAAIKAERIDQLAIVRAERQAQARTASASAAAHKAASKAQLVPTAVTRRTATIAATAAARAGLAASTYQARTGTKGQIAAAKAAATIQANQQLDQLNAQLLEQLQQFERGNLGALGKG